MTPNDVTHANPWGAPDAGSLFGIVYQRAELAAGSIARCPFKAKG
jgi:hypothetical protein